MSEPSVTVTKRTPITHEVVVVDKRGETATFRRSVDGTWEQWSFQRGRWESFGYPLAEALLDKVVEAT